MLKLSFAIVGAGPAGFYMGKYLSKLPQEPIIHIYEKQYCPFGLIRYGVAPDHITIKKSQNTLSSLANYPFFKYSGNTTVDQQYFNRLKDKYSGVIFASGAQKDNTPAWMNDSIDMNKDKRKLNAREIVYWYNNHPKYEQFELDLSKTKNVVIIGNGNVAIDISRILLRSASELQETEISQNALTALKNSVIKNVTLVGRRGFTHSAFALKELRQLTKHKIKIYCIEQEMEESINEASYVQSTDIGNNRTAEVRMNKRKIEFVRTKCHIIKKHELQSIMNNEQRKVILRFLLDPLKVDRQHIQFAVTTLEGQPFKQKAVRTTQQENIPFDLLVNSTGFQVQAIDSSQTDLSNNCIANSNGCVLNHSRDKLDMGVYAVGWCKSGPRGVIDQTLLGCQQTFNNLRIHSDKKILLEKSIPELESKVTFDRYLQLKELQLSRGNRQKFMKKKLNHKEVVQFFNQ